ncbi:LysR family transcriptional regulator [Amycolatopsis rhabdoformis]|uniref:LysR family transcriptional regulator n=1 Tax=Amycolatopsis rhabdoformis TaxID=1448059 RepID=A0ABZ1I6A0_9PSEU|nr:LysR family transcriptional regulator [Amycolatopsis rhabdoformis]WSE29895.1 LysR family transcriptional regulator [Amycolatopsis rhabdoformis]
MAVTLRQLAVFAAVAEHGGFGAAATALGLGQSSVSHSLAALETAVHGEVVRRATPVRLTPLGELLLPHARATLTAARGFDAAATTYAGTAATATISLSVPPTVARGLLPGLLRLWHERLPQVEITVFEAVDDEIAQWLESGTVDASFLIDPDPFPVGGLHVATDAYEAVVRTDHPLAGEPQVDLADLLDDPLLVTTSGFVAPLEHLHATAGVPYRPARHIRELATVLSMVEAGLGVAILPSLAAAMLPDALTLVPLRPRLERRLVLTGPTTRPWHPSVVTLRDLAADLAGTSGGRRTRR